MFTRYKKRRREKLNEQRVHERVQKQQKAIEEKIAKKNSRLKEMEDEANAANA